MFEQRLVKIIFDGFKLNQAMRFSGAHVLGHAKKHKGCFKIGKRTTHALVFEVLNHQVGGVSKLFVGDLERILLEPSQAIINAGAFPVSWICDDYSTHLEGNYKSGASGKVHYEYLQRYVFCEYDYVHKFKNTRNNWITVVNNKCHM